MNSAPGGKDIEAWQPVEILQVERLACELTRKVFYLTKKDYISPRLNRLRISQGRQRSQRHRDLKNNQKFLLCVPCALCERNIFINA